MTPITWLVKFPDKDRQLDVYLCAVLQLKLIEESPSISQVWLNLHCSKEPLSGFGNFPLTPE